MFVDRVKIRVRGGNGGNGCSSFRREKYVPKGGPDGGDGGPGGDVILMASTDEQSLVALRFQQHYEGANGAHGKGKDRNGACGENKIVKVPCGTVVRDSETDEILCDLSEEGQQFVVAKGGKGGWGNCHFASSRNRVPRRCDPGEEGEEKHLQLELKTISDVGLVGYPNAGKSTFLGSISDAHPKTAPYPFTTLHPMVGVVQFDDFFRFTVADIPGLIDGAHENVGLGHHFLRHIERAGILVFVLDMEGTDDRDPLQDLENLREELRLYSEEIVLRRAIIVANKMDGKNSAENLQRLLEQERDINVFPTCAELKEGTNEVVLELRKMIEAERLQKQAEKQQAEKQRELSRQQELPDWDEISNMDSQI